MSLGHILIFKGGPLILGKTLSKIRKVIIIYYVEKLMEQLLKSKKIKIFGIHFNFMALKGMMDAAEKGKKPELQGCQLAQLSKISR